MSHISYIFASQMITFATLFSFLHNVEFKNSIYFLGNTMISNASNLFMQSFKVCPIAELGLIHYLLAAKLKCLEPRLGKEVNGNS